MHEARIACMVDSERLLDCAISILARHVAITKQDWRHTMIFVTYS